MRTDAQIERHEQRAEIKALALAARLGFRLDSVEARCPDVGPTVLDVFLRRGYTEAQQIGLDVLLRAEGYTAMFFEPTENRGTFRRVA